MKKTIFFICLLSLTLSAQICFGATYYVAKTDGDGVTGSGDGGSGSATDPWYHIAEITGLAAGDTVKFHTGDTWAETLTCSTSGTSAALPVTYTYYGTGVTPVIDGADTRNNGIASAGMDFITIDGFEIKETVTDGIVLNSGTENFTVKNCYIHDTTQNGIAIYSTSASSKNNTIQNNTICHLGLAATSGEFGGRGNGIFIDGTNATTRTEDTVIENNHIYDLGFDYHDHCIYDHGYETIVRYNKLINSKGFGHKMTNNKSTGGTSCGGGCQTYNNIIANNKTGGILIEAVHNTEDATNLLSVPINNKVYNNTLYHNAQADVASQYYTGLQYTYVEGTPSGNEFKNNIVIAPDVAASKVYFFLAGTAANSLTGLTFDNNDYYSLNAQLFRVGQDGGENSTSLAQWQGRSYTGTNDNLSIASDPLFTSTSAGAEDFTLNYCSPAINAGVNVGLTLDYAGNAIPFDLIPDIGAYEWTRGQE